MSNILAVASTKVPKSYDPSKFRIMTYAGYAVTTDRVETVIGGTAIVDEDFSSPGLMVTDGSGSYSVTPDEHVNWDNAYTHSVDNTQAHSDYLINNGDDSTSGSLTIGGDLDIIGDIYINGKKAKTFVVATTAYALEAPTTTQITFIIKNISAGDIIVTPFTGTLIDGETTQTIPTMSTLQVMSYDATNWYII